MGARLRRGKVPASAVVLAAPLRGVAGPCTFTPRGDQKAARRRDPCATCVCSKSPERGVFVGKLFNLTTPPGAHWWGEGDEKMWVDHDPFPTLFGTGTEDYFGYAWASSKRFNHALHSQTRAPTRGFGGVFSMNRFHTLDAIPFNKSFRFDLELWHWTNTRIGWSAITYYYASPGTKEEW